MIRNEQMYYGSFFLILIVLLVISQSKVYGQSPIAPDILPVNTPEIITLPKTHHLLSKAIFSQDDQVNVIVNPVFDDNSTNIAFYIQCPSQACTDVGTVVAPLYIFTAENLGHGSLPLTKYWEVPAHTSYVALEYKNDNQQFSCSNLTLEQCISDTHFIKRFNFEVVASGVAITKAMTEVVETKNADTPNVSDALLQLSISLSSTSISSNLENGLIVTASLDNIISIATTTIATQTNKVIETNDNPPPSSFIQNIVESIIEIFTDPIPTPAVPTAPQAESSPTVEAAPEGPPHDFTATPFAVENEVQSPVVHDEVITNDITTTTF